MASFKDSEVTKEHVIDNATTGDAPEAAAAAASSSRDHGVETSSSDESLDDNYKLFQAVAAEEFSEDEAKRVLRKIDMRIVPVLFVTYFLQYLDKSERLSLPNLLGFFLPTLQVTNADMAAQTQTPSTSPASLASRRAPTCTGRTTHG